MNSIQRYHESRELGRQIYTAKIKDASMKWLPLSELRLYYLMEINSRNAQEHFIWGSPGEEVPSLTGWIKYWRKTVKEKDWVIVYPKRNKNDHNIQG